MKQLLPCYLASGSPRRRELLQQVGLDFTVLVTDADESTDITDPAEKGGRIPGLDRSCHLTFINPPAFIENRYIKNLSADHVIRKILFPAVLRVF